MGEKVWLVSDRLFIAARKNQDVLLLENNQLQDGVMSPNMKRKGLLFSYYSTSNSFLPYLNILLFSFILYLN